MADQKISELTALTGANVADDDAIAIVDTSATETKKIVFSELKNALDTATGFVRITGDTMTGALTTTGLTVDKASGSLIDLNATASGTPTNYITYSDTGGATAYVGFDSGANDNFTVYNATATGDITLRTNSLQRLNIDGATGDISFYEDTGTTAKFFWDASAERLGIGTSLPSTVIDARQTSTGGSTQIRVYNTDNSNTTTQTAALFLSPDSRSNGALIFAEKENADFSTSAGRDISLVFSPVLNNTQTEAMRIDSGGVVNIKNTASTANFVSETATSFIVGDGSGTQAMTLYSGTANNGSLYFADGSSGNATYRGGVQYLHGSDAMRFFTSADETMRIDSSGNVGIKVVPKTTNATITGSLNINRTGIIVRNNEQVYWTSNIYWDASDQMKSLGSGYGVLTAFIPSDGSQRFYTTTASAGSADANLTLDETMRITSGNLFVGKTSANLALTGIQATSSGQAFSVTRDGGAPFNLNRLTSPGELAGFWEDTVKVGSIGSEGGDALYIQSGTTSGSGLHFKSNVGVIRPARNGATIDNAIDLGSDTRRFKDLYLSSSIILQRAESASVGTFGRNTDGTARTLFTFRSESQNATVGTIAVTNSTTAYNTSSDYRLKTDAQPMTGATDRLKQLNPVNFEWIADGTRVDGFLAHEAQAVVPEAVTGAKDAMRDEEYEVTPAVLDDDGNVVTEAVMGTRSVPDYQGIDQSKLVPLLVATIKELEARITALENA